MPEVDYETIKACALAQAETVLAHWLPSGSREGKDWVALNPTRDDKSKGSFKIQIDGGFGKDFSTDERIGDLIALVARVDRIKNSEAAVRLAKFLGLAEDQIYLSENAPQPLPQKKVTNKPPEFNPVYPPPAQAGDSCPTSHPRNGKPSMCWDYRASDGALLMRVMRFDSNKKGQRKKDFRPLAYGSMDEQPPKWHWRQLPANRPLYRLDQFNNHHTTTVLCEGEKAADAAAKLFPDYFVTCWSSGVKAIGKTDFSPLKSQRVIYWPDNDEAGQASIAVLNKQLAGIGITDFVTVNLGFFSDHQPQSNGTWSAGGDWPDKADAYDAVEQGWTATHLTKAIQQGVLLDTGEIAEPQAQDVIPHGYKLNDQGIWLMDNDGNFSKISAPIEILARSRSGYGDGRNWGLLTRFRDHDGEEKTFNIPMTDFAADGTNQVMKGLLDRGLHISSHRNARRGVLTYLQEYDSKKRVSLVYKMGWHNGAFVLPDRVIGTDQHLHFYSESPPLCKLGTSGTLDQWQQHVSRYCQGNPLAMFAVSAALSAPLVEVMGFESMGFHYYGDSSWGKSTLLELASSVYGNPEEYKCTFRATDNALESIAGSHSDMLLALDEINQADPRAIGEIIYMLGNGQGKHRANDRGQARESLHKWKLTYLTNGEKTLEQYLHDAGKKVTGGMEMRFLGILGTPHDDPATRIHLGVFDHCHQFEGGAALSNHLKRQMLQYHGTAFPKFIEKFIQNDRPTLIKVLLDGIASFKQQHITAAAGGQVERAATKFALVGLAGELATTWGLTGWNAKEAFHAAGVCFQSWLKARGGEGNMEDKQMLNDFRKKIEMFGDIRFKRWDKETPDIASHVPSPVECWGFRRHDNRRDPVNGASQDAIYLVYTSAFKDELCKGYDHKRVARLLRDKGALIQTESEQRENRFTTKARLPGTGKKTANVYKILSSALLGDS